MWNAAVSAAFHELIHHSEVALRNAVARGLQDVFGTEDWVEPLKAHHRTTNRTRHDLEDAQEILARDGPVTPGRVVAHMSFGFWTFLLSKHFEQHLWTAGVYRQFEESLSPRRLRKAADNVRGLRNRISHHEPGGSAVSREDWG